jgi:hypothetical protein
MKIFNFSTQLFAQKKQTLQNTSSEIEIKTENDVQIITIHGQRAYSIYNSIRTEALRIMSVPEKMVYQKIGDQSVCTRMSSLTNKSSKSEFSCEIRMRDDKILNVGVE